MSLRRHRRCLLPYFRNDQRMIYSSINALICLTCCHNLCERIQKAGRKCADMTLWHHFVHISRRHVSIVRTLTDVNIWDYEGRWSTMGGSIKKHPPCSSSEDYLVNWSFSLSHSTGSLCVCSLRGVVAMTGLIYAIHDTPQTVWLQSGRCLLL